MNLEMRCEISPFDGSLECQARIVRFIRHLPFILCLTLLAGCSTSNPSSTATAVAYERFEQGIKDNRVYSRQDVYLLLGQPYSVKPPGDIAHCQTATWKIPHDVSGWGHLTVVFSNDIAVHYECNILMVRVYKSVSLERMMQMQPFEALVEGVVVRHHWFFKPDVSIYLQRSDNGKRLALEILGAKEGGLKFADELRQGNNYVFPTVITDFFLKAQGAKIDTSK